MMLRASAAYLFFSAALFVTGCTPSARLTNGWGRVYEPEPEIGSREVVRAEPEPETPVETERVDPNPGVPEFTSHGASTHGAATLEGVLRTEIDHWLGVPYALGGTTLRGVDCSGLVQRVFADALNISTPRTTSGLKRAGKKVDGKALRTGDLVFFEPGGRYSHVGIYLGEGQFAHASSSGGVMISDLSEDYWRRTYTMSRRILDSGDTVVAGLIPTGSSERPGTGPHW